MRQKKVYHGDFFLILTHDNVKIKNLKDQNPPMRGFSVRAPFLTFLHEKTTFQWSKVVSEAVFPAN